MQLLFIYLSSDDNCSCNLLQAAALRKSSFLVSLLIKFAISICMINFHRESELMEGVVCELFSLFVCYHMQTRFVHTEVNLSLGKAI